MNFYCTVLGHKKIIGLDHEQEIFITGVFWGPTYQARFTERNALRICTDFFVSSLNIIFFGFKNNNGVVCMVKIIQLMSKFRS